MISVLIILWIVYSRHSLNALYCAIIVMLFQVIWLRVLHMLLWHLPILLLHRTQWWNTWTATISDCWTCACWYRTPSCIFALFSTSSLKYVYQGFFEVPIHGPKPLSFLPTCLHSRSLYYNGRVLLTVFKSNYKFVTLALCTLFRKSYVHRTSGEFGIGINYRFVVCDLCWAYLWCPKNFLLWEYEDSLEV